MKKIFFLLILIMFLFAFTACTVQEDIIFDDEMQSSEQEKTTEDQESYDESLESRGDESTEATSEETAEQTECEQSSELEYESSIESSIEEPIESSEEDSSSEIIDTPPEKITEIGNFSTVSGTVESYDRLRQMSLSAAVYNIGSVYTDTELSSVRSSAGKIVLGGSLTYRNAAKLMKHYLDGSGENFIIDMISFLSDQTTLQNRNADIEKALRAAEILVYEGESVDIYQMQESIFHNLSGDWKYALGSYFTSIEMNNVTFNGEIYTATLKYKAIDFYNWDEGNSSAVFTGTIANIVGDISPKDLHQLHKAGMAQEFLSVGEITYELSWRLGDNAETAIQN